ncbi:MAG: ComF family protein [Actinobacteria bacterium]|nr:ComF family protein [Actinomycetota bacterium]
MFKNIIKLIFPTKCIFCREFTDMGKEIEICELCYRKLNFIPDRFGIIPCGQLQTIYFESFISVFEYSGIVKKSLQRFKFHNKPSYFRTYARMLSEKVKKVTSIDSFDIVISVPLFYNKERIRGYNQALLISKALSRETGIIEGSRLIKRIKDTGSQSLLSKKQRDFNIKDAFEIVDINAIRGKSILLVDDILTTGSTINECSKVLKKAGAIKVVAAVVATGRSM